MDGFQILSKLGEGAYSIVLKVRRNYDNNIYALKKVKLLKLSEKEKNNALNEVRLLASVKSSFVISYKEAFFDEKESCLGIVMEYADKGDLYQKITEYKKTAMLFEESDIWRILLQLIKGLKSLHDLKILHRDLKSANVFLFSDGSVKLGDLNVSKVAKKGLGYTQTGTPYYASPEVWKDQPYNNKSDIWSLGCVLYEMITLHPPFRAENMEGLFNKVIKGKYKNIPNRFSSDLSEIVRLLIQVDPEKRPSCDELLMNNIIMKRIEYFKSFCGDDVNEDQALLKTIIIPKNLLFLGSNLPEPNYVKKRFNSFTNLKNANKDFDEKEKEKSNTNNKINRNGFKNENIEIKKEDEKKINENNKNDGNEKKNERKINKEDEKLDDEGEKIRKERERKINEEILKREQELKIRENELQLKKQLEEKEKNAYKYNKISRNIQEESKNITKEVTQRSHKNIINSRQSHKKIILPEIRNSYDITPIKINYNNNNRPVYDGYNRSKKYRILLSNEEEEINKLYKIYAPVLKPQNKLTRYIYNHNLQIKNVPRPYNYYNMKGKNNNERYNDGRKLNPIPRKYFNNLY